MFLCADLYDVNVVKERKMPALMISVTTGRPVAFFLREGQDPAREDPGTRTGKFSV